MDDLCSLREGKTKTETPMKERHLRDRTAYGWHPERRRNVQRRFDHNAEVTRAVNNLIDGGLLRSDSSATSVPGHSKLNTGPRVGPGGRGSPKSESKGTVVVNTYAVAHLCFIPVPWNKQTASRHRPGQAAPPPLQLFAS